MKNHYWVVNEEDDEDYGYDDNLTYSEAEDLLERLSERYPYSSFDIDSDRVW